GAGSLGTELPQPARPSTSRNQVAKRKRVMSIPSVLVKGGRGTTPPHGEKAVAGAVAPPLRPLSACLVRDAPDVDDLAFLPPRHVDVGVPVGAALRDPLLDGMHRAVTEGEVDDRRVATAERVPRRGLGNAGE